VGTAPHVGDRLNQLLYELGDRLLGAGVVDDVLAISGAGDECGGRGAAVRRAGLVFGKPTRPCTGGRLSGAIARENVLSRNTLYAELASPTPRHSARPRCASLSCYTWSGV
jgi:hypothetical protein